MKNKTKEWQWCLGSFRQTDCNQLTGRKSIIYSVKYEFPVAPEEVG